MDSSASVASDLLVRAGDIHLNKQDLVVLAITWASVLVSCGIWWLILLEML
jgi:hypothetical protein